MTYGSVQSSGALAIVLNQPSSVRVATPNMQPTPKIDPKVEDAVYQYIRAKRTLGHLRVNTRSIADALDLPHATVARVVKGMAGKGVRTLGKHR